MPVIVTMWKEEQEKLVEKLFNLEGGVVLSGDGRSAAKVTVPSMGHLQSLNKELDVQLVQVSYPSSGH